jgi:hypothetical protein
VLFWVHPVATRRKHAGQRGAGGGVVLGYASEVHRNNQTEAA